MGIPNKISPIGTPEVLPTGYTRLAYLENSVRSHIATGLQVPNNARVEITATPLKREWVDCFCGNYVINDTGNYYAIVYSASSNPTILYSNGVNSWNTQIATVFGKKYNIVADGGNFYIDGERVLSELELSASFTTPNFYLFSRGYSGPNPLATGRMRLYDFNVRNDGIQQADYVPVVDPAGVPCMYDKVTHTAKYPSVKNSLLAGIETQYQLDTLLSNLPNKTGSTKGQITLHIDPSMYSYGNTTKITRTGSEKNWDIQFEYV